MKGEGLTVLADTDLRSLAVEGAVTFTETAHDVEALERDPRRIDLGVAGRARFERAMFLQLLTDRHGPTSVRLDGGYAGRRRWRFTAEDALHDPGAADDGRCRGAVGSDLEHRGLRHETAAHAAGRQGDFAQLHAFDGRELVERGKAFVDEDEVRLDDGAGREVRAEELGEGGVALVPGRIQQMVVEIVIRVQQAVRVVGAGLAQFEPVVGERFDETLRTGVGKQTAGSRSFFASAKARSSASGGEFHRKKLRREATAWSSSAPGASRR